MDALLNTGNFTETERSKMRMAAFIVGCSFMKGKSESASTVYQCVETFRLNYIIEARNDARSQAVGKVKAANRRLEKVTFPVSNQFGPVYSTLGVVVERQLWTVSQYYQFSRL